MSHVLDFLNRNLHAGFLNKFGVNISDRRNQRGHFVHVSPGYMLTMLPVVCFLSGF